MKFQPEFKKFFADNAEERRYDYPELNESSIVVDVGGYKGDFASKIIHKYNPTVYIFEPVEKFCAQIAQRLRNEGIMSRTALQNGGLSDKDEIKEINLLDDGTSTTQPSENKVECAFYNVVEILDTIMDSSGSQIDLLKLNIEGDEFKLLEELVKDENSDVLENIKNIQVQFHNFVENCEDRRDKIMQKLNDTHEQSWCYYFVWENWKLKP